MPLNLIRRLVKGSPLTAADHDGNLDVLETAIEGKEASGAAAAAVAAHAAAADPHPGYLTAAEGAASFATTAQGAKADTAVQPGAIGSSGLTMTAGILGRETGTGAPQVFTIGANLAIVNGALTATASGGGYPTFGAPTGFSVTGSGTASISLSFAAGYGLPTTASQANWDTAYNERARWDGGATGLDAATARTSLGLAALYQPLDADLTSIAALTTTTFGRSLLTQADAAAARTTLGAGTGNGTVTGVTATGLLTSSGGTAPQISSSIATNSLAGRFSAGTGALEAITIGSGLAISGGALVVTAGGTGTVTSVGLSLPGIFTVSGSPVTTSGTLTAALATQNANLIFAGPSSGAAAAPTFRALATADLPGVIQVATELTLPLNAPGSPTARDIYAVADTIRYRDSANAERLLLNATDNLANLSNTTTARGNIGAAASGAIGSSGLTMATARLLGRTTASTGAPEEITVGSGLSLSAGTLTATGGGGASFAGYAANNWIQPVTGTIGPGTASTANTIYLYPFTVQRSITVSDLGARVTTAGTNFALAIYGSASGLPTGLPLANTGTLVGTTATVVPSTVTAFDLTAGTLYWGAFNSDAAIAMMHMAGANTYFNSIIGTATLSEIASGGSISSWVRTLTGQAFTNPWPDLTGVTTTVITTATTLRGALIFLKVSALL